MSLNISSKLSLPVEAWRWTFADLGIKGSGKTYVASDLAEEMMKNNIPILVIDPLGIWWGLRVGADGSSKGYPVVIFGGEHRDIPIPTRIDSKSKFPQVDEERLKLMVKSILQAGISAVVDTSEFSKHMQRRASTIILRELFQINKSYGKRHVFLEEVDTLAPQRLSGELNESFGAVDEIVRRGGNFLLGATLISQRPAVVNKDILTQCNCLIILRILAKLDKDAVSSWVKEISGRDPKEYAKWYDSLKDLCNGQGWIWHPETDLFEKIQFRKRETLHATREYFDQEDWQQKNVSLMDVGEFVSKFKKVFEPKQEPKKVEQVVKQSQPIVRDDMQMVTSFVPPQVSTSNIKTEPDSSVKLVNQSLPTIQIHQFKPTLQIPVEMQEPTTMLGKVCVVLKNGPPPQGTDSRWNKKAIAERLQAHGWDAAGYEDVIEQLLRWEILRVSAQYLAFDKTRVQIVDRGSAIQVS